MEKKDKKNDFPDIDEERMPVTKIIVKDLMRGTYREGYARPIDWKPKTAPAKFKKIEKTDEQAVKKRTKIIAVAVVLAAIFIVIAIAAITAIITIKIWTPSHEITNYKNIDPSPEEIYKEPSAPVERSYYYSAPNQNNTPVLNNTQERHTYYEEQKEKIYMWVEDGIRHYTNLEGVAKSKNAVELK